MPTNTQIANLSFRTLTALTIIMAVGTYLRAIDVWRPIDGSATMISTIWRETDVASVARNFHREDNNILYPRTQWRENTPGYVESEFPLYPWLVAQTYNVFGYQEQYARLLSLLISALTLLVLTRLSFFLFNEIGALVATAFFAVNPLLIYLSTAVQSDTLMFLFLSLALYYYMRHIRESSGSREFLISAAFVSLAMLCKASAAPYALFFALDTLRRDGLKQTLVSKATYIALAIIVAPNLAWVTHSHQFWLDYRMSFGVTNESHLIGSDMIFDWKYYRGFINSTVSYITSYPGALALIVGLWLIRKSQLAKPLYILGVSLGVFYYAILFTTGASWAFYYHVLSVPFVGMVFGVAAEEIILLRREFSFGRSLAFLGLPTALVGFGLGMALGFSIPFAVALGALTLALTVAFLLYQSSPERQVDKAFAFRHDVAIAATAVVLIALSARSFRLVPQERNFVAWNECAVGFAEQVPKTARIAAWGSRSFSAPGRIVAYNVPWMFYWMDREGFSIPEDSQTVATVDSVARQGAEFYVEYLAGSQRTPGFHEALRKRYTMLDSCGEHLLYSIRTPKTPELPLK